MALFFINKLFWKHHFIMQFLHLPDRLNKVRTEIKNVVDATVKL